MKLRLKKGAIVKFNLITAESVIGKVICVLDEEIEIVTQIRVRKDTDDFEFVILDGIPGFDEEQVEILKPDELDVTKTMDSDVHIHLNRNFIVSWQYANIDEISSEKVVYENEKKSPSLKDVESYRVNYFEKDGYFKGNGDYI